MAQKDLYKEHLASSEVAGYAEIIIPAALPKNYTWSVPLHLKETVLPGCRVEVNLGKTKK